MTCSVEAFFDKTTFTITYIVYDQESKDAIIIDPVLDYDIASSTITSTSINKVLDFIKGNDLNTHYILETHAHADHITGAQDLKVKLPGAKVGIGKNITLVQSTFKDIYNLKELDVEGSQFDILLDENEELVAGTIIVKTIFTPGHTPACSSYLIENNVFTGDALFIEDFGTGRCDFPKGDAQDLYVSVHEKLYDLPDDTNVYVGHDYQPNNRELRYKTTIGVSKSSNIQLKQSTSLEEFVKFRTDRDKKLNAPRLLFPSIQVNIDGGKLPHAEDNGKRYLKIPLFGDL
jgi:glyoxylase-like metal-dependent hydrolase (beta-lactamase superfamily II)